MNYLSHNDLYVDDDDSPSYIIMSVIAKGCQYTRLVSSNHPAEQAGHRGATPGIVETRSEFRNAK